MDQMHSLRQVESDIRREMASHREELERTLSESIRRAEETTFHRVEQLFTPQVVDLRLRLDQTLPPLHSRIEEVSLCSKQDLDAVIKRLENALEGLNTEISGIHTTLPPLRRHCEDHARVLKRLEAAEPKLFEALQEMRKEMYDWREELRHDLSNERRRAEGAEADFAHKMQERLDAISIMTHEFDERATKQTKDAVHTAGIVEKHVLARLDDTREFVTVEARRVAAETETHMRPEIHEIVEQMQRGMDECRSCLEVRASGLEAQIRRELQIFLQNAFADSEESHKFRITELAQAMSKGFEEHRQDLRTQAQGLTDTAERWREVQGLALDHSAAEAAEARNLAEQAKSLASSAERWVALHAAKVDRTWGFVASQTELKPWTTPVASGLLGTADGQKPWTPTTAGTLGTTLGSDSDSLLQTFDFTGNTSCSAQGSMSPLDARPSSRRPAPEDVDSGVVF